MLNNEKKLFSFTRNANNVAWIKTCLNKCLYCERRNRKPVECQPARLKKDEQAIQDLTLDDFNSDPFGDSFPALRSLKNGIVTTTEILEDLKIVIDTADTDVYVQAAYVSQQVEGDLCIRRKGSFLICRNMLRENVAKIIIPAHVITGTDHTSGFFGHGKNL